MEPTPSSFYIFLPKAELKAKRKIAIQKQKGQVKEGDKASQKSSRVESKKRANRDSSVSSTASTYTDRRGGQSSSQTGGRLTYKNKHHALLGHHNEGKRVRAILENRYHSSGTSGTGTL